MSKFINIQIESPAAMERFNDLLNDEFDFTVINVYDEIKKQHIGDCIIYGLKRGRKRASIHK